MPNCDPLQLDLRSLKRQLTYYVLMLLLESAMIGVFISLDLLLFYLFFESFAGADVFPLGGLGGRAADICRNQILHLPSVVRC